MVEIDVKYFYHYIIYHVREFVFLLTFFKASESVQQNKKARFLHENLTPTLDDHAQSVPCTSKQSLTNSEDVEMNYAPCVNQASETDTIIMENYK